jgi:hypothetical protein
MFRYIRVVSELMLSQFGNDRWLATAPDFTAMQGLPEDLLKKKAVLPVPYQLSKRALYLRPSTNSPSPLSS